MIRLCTGLGALTAAVAIVAVATIGCGGDSGATADANDGATGSADARPGIADAAITPDRIDPLLWVDFSASGCAAGGTDGAPCLGPAALEVQFAAIAPAEVATYVWSFGDGTGPSSSPAPLHRFLLPGSYDVSLTVGGPGGTATMLHEQFVQVTTASLGAQCSLSEQCDPALTCICGDGAACAAGFGDGMCSAPCGDLQTCPTGSSCANLAPAGSGEAPWRTNLCLPNCDHNDDCRAGFACQELPANSGTAWVRGCFPAGLLGDVGQSCVTGNGLPDDAQCASGACLAQGARGLCVASCDECPSYAACATFAASSGLGALCLARCSEQSPCTSDPWLACTEAGGDGAKSFSVEEAAAGDGYCAPRRCELPSDCGPDGDCLNGYCGPAAP